MKKPTRTDFGWTKEMKWVEGFQDRYYEALKAWENQPKTTTGGRQRSRPIHPSWEPVLKHFDSTNPTRSQGAFCRWAKINRASFSSWQTKELHEDSALKKWILLWVKEKDSENKFSEFSEALNNGVKAIQEFSKMIQNEQ